MRVARLLLGCAVLLVAGACTGGDDASPTATPAGSTATGTVVASPSATPTPVMPTSTVVATATPVVSDPIAGLFREPRFEEPDASVQLEPKVSGLPSHDGLSTVLYDIENGTVRDLGFGMLGTFSTDSRYMAWAAFADDRSEPSTLRVIDVQSGVITDLGEVDSVAHFSDERHVNVRPAGGGRLELVDVETGERKSSDAIDVKRSELRSDHFLGERHDIEGSGEYLYRIFDRETTDLVLRVTALDARIVPDGQLLLLVDAGLGVGNIFLVDLDSLEAEFVATTLTEPFARSSIPIAASEDYIVWTPNYCDGEYYQSVGDPSVYDLERRPGSEPAVGNTMLFNRATGMLTELVDEHLVILSFTPDGRMVDGIIGGLALLDPTLPAWDVVLPEGSTPVRWSPDYRYASRGEQLGHGGYCPP